MRGDIGYAKYLAEEEAYWQTRNTKVRSRNSTARPIYLIDEAQDSYEEEGLWTLLKNHHNTRNAPLFVLVCVYGATGVSRLRDPNIESQASKMHQKRRNLHSNRSWGVPEAAFQDELYCCLGLELHYLPILSEYSHTDRGQIHFLVSNRKWGIEILQCGGYTEIVEHATRFSSGGSYKKWDILEDYIILDFCSRSALREVKLEGEFSCYLFSKRKANLSVRSRNSETHFSHCYTAW